MTNTQTPFRITNLCSARKKGLLTHEGCSLFAASACFLLGFSILPHLFVTCQFCCLFLAPRWGACIAFLFSSFLVDLLSLFVKLKSFYPTTTTTHPHSSFSHLKAQKATAYRRSFISRPHRPPKAPAFCQLCLTFCALNKFSAHINRKVLHYAPLSLKTRLLCFYGDRKKQNF